MRGFAFDTVGLATVETEPKSKAPIIAIQNQSKGQFSVTKLHNSQSPILIKKHTRSCKVTHLPVEIDSLYD